MYLVCFGFPHANRVIKEMLGTIRTTLYGVIGNMINEYQNLYNTCEWRFFPHSGQHWQSRQKRTSRRPRWQGLKWFLHFSVMLFISLNSPVKFWFILLGLHSGTGNLVEILSKPKFLFVCNILYCFSCYNYKKKNERTKTSLPCWNTFWQWI